MRKQSGITLIALIITIIVLLILAGVTIATVTGDDGMIGKATTAAEKTSIADDVTKIGMSVSEYQIEKYADGNADIEEFLKAEEWCKDAIHNEKANATVVTTNEDRKYTIIGSEIHSGAFDFIVSTKEELQEKLSGVEDGSVIGVSGEIDLSGISLGNKKIVLDGFEQSGTMIMDNSFFYGEELVIRNMKIKTLNTDYKGFTAEKVNYENCTIEGTYFCFVKNPTFKDCTFNVTGNRYNIWTYDANTIKFENCTFNCDGKSVLIYKEGSGGLTRTVNVNNCKFIANTAVDGKASIEIDSSLGEIYIVNINNCSTTGFGKGSVSGEELWNEKNGNLSKIYVDGTQVR